MFQIYGDQSINLDVSVVINSNLKAFISIFISIHAAKVKEVLTTVLSVTQYCCLHYYKKLCVLGKNPLLQMQTYTQI